MTVWRNLAIAVLVFSASAPLLRAQDLSKYHAVSLGDKLYRLQP